MKQIVINRSYDEFCISHQALARLRELGQREALEEENSGAYWPAAGGPREPSLNQYGKLIPRDDANFGHGATLRIVMIPADVKWVITKTEGGEQISEVHRTWGGVT